MGPCKAISERTSPAPHERILGDGEFVENALAQAEENLERNIVLKPRDLILKKLWTVWPNSWI